MPMEMEVRNKKLRLFEQFDSLNTQRNSKNYELLQLYNAHAYIRLRNITANKIKMIHSDEKLDPHSKMQKIKEILKSHFDILEKTPHQWDKIDTEVFLNIIKYLKPKDISQCRLVCKKWSDCLKFVDDFVWREECLRYISNSPAYYSFQERDLDETCILTWKSQLQILENWKTKNFEFISRSTDFMIPKSASPLCRNSKCVMPTISIEAEKDPVCDNKIKRVVAAIPYRNVGTTCLTFCDRSLYWTMELSNVVYQLTLYDDDFSQNQEEVIFRSSLPVISLMPDECGQIAVLDAGKQLTILNSDPWIEYESPKKKLMELKIPGFVCSFDGQSQRIVVLGPSPESQSLDTAEQREDESENEYYLRLFNEDRQRSNWHLDNNTIYVYSSKNAQLMHQIDLDVSKWTDIPPWNPGSGNISIRGDFICIGYTNGLFVSLVKNKSTGIYGGACKMYGTEIDMHDFTYAPNVMHFGPNFLVTNGGYPDELMVWGQGLSERQNRDKIRERREEIWRHPSLMTPTSCATNQDNDASQDPNSGVKKSTIKHLQYILAEYCLSETIAMEKEDIHVAPFRDISSAYVDRDETSLFCPTSSGTSDVLLVWDFRARNVPREFNRYFLKRRLGRTHFWIVYDVLN